MFIGTLGYSQYEYIIKLNDNSKESLSNITKDIITYNRTIDSTLHFYSTVDFDFDFMDSICVLYGYNIMSFNKIISGGSPQFHLKSGENTDCGNATLICDNNSFGGNSNGFGIQELNSTNQGCLFGENQSAWYYLSIETAGTLEMTIAPSGNSDYDWVIWGPFTEATIVNNCPPLTSPIRCNYAQYPRTGFFPFLCGTNTLNTGMLAGNANTNATACQNRPFLAPLNVLSDEFYILLIDNFTSSTIGYEVTWGGTATLGCTPVLLPIELQSFIGKPMGDYNALEWVTASEINNDYFIIENSVDGYVWNTVATVKGAGNSSQTNTYKVNHKNYKDSINYYRLTQVDFDGRNETFHVISIDNRIEPKELIKVVNFMGQTVSNTDKGLFIEIYSDGTTRKISRD